jgi:3-methyl-2-oxobutanoate hydroxymethyltransferase
MKKLTTADIRSMKGGEKIACLTAGDCAMARLLDEAGIHLILVGDSLGMTLLGFDDTLPVTMEHMLHHTAAVVRGTKQALVVADMPFMSYQAGIDEAVANAGRFLKEAGADAVKIEGGAFRAELITTLTRNGIPTLAHIGMTPQSVREFGGYKVQGKTPEAATTLIEDARSVAAAGAFALVLECVPGPVSADITAAVDIPTIGIGAGAACDGQVLVSNDILGLYAGHTPKFVKPYAALGQAMKDAFTAYREDVRKGDFPGPEHTY